MNSKLRLIFQKVIMIVILIGCMVSVIPFLFLLVDAMINKTESLFLSGIKFMESKVE